LQTETQASIGGISLQNNGPVLSSIADNNRKCREILEFAHHYIWFWLMPNISVEQLLEDVIWVMPTITEDFIYIMYRYFAWHKIGVSHAQGNWCIALFLLTSVFVISCYCCLITSLHCSNCSSMWWSIFIFTMVL